MIPLNFFGLSVMQRTSRFPGGIYTPPNVGGVVSAPKVSTMPVFRGGAPRPPHQFMGFKPFSPKGRR